MVTIHRKVEIPNLESNEIYKIVSGEMKSLAQRWSLSEPEWFIDENYHEIFCSDKRGSFRLDVVDHMVHVDAKLSASLWHIMPESRFNTEFDDWIQGAFQTRHE